MPKMLITLNDEQNRVLQLFKIENKLQSKEAALKLIIDSFNAKVNFGYCSNENDEAATI